jgi:5-bromo-4-chloroindolyl phosphate hydrolysis protein
MAAQRYGGRHSPDGTRSGAEAPAPAPFRNRRAARVSVRARLLYLAPLPLLFAGLGAIGRGSAGEMLVEIGGFAALMLAAFMVNEGLKAEAAYDARAVARPPAIPRKLLAALLTGLAVAAVGALSLGQGIVGGAVFGAVAGAALIAAFGLDPMKKKGLEGVDAFATERVAKAIDEAEGLLRTTLAAAQRIGDRRLEGRIERLCAQAREVFRVVEQDPRDLTRARKFLNVYLVGLRDATVKFADLWGRSRDREVLVKYEDLIGDLETSFNRHRTDLLEDNRSDLDVEIEVLRDRLQQDGLTAR